ncbi:MAG: hypothetical protein EZS28_028125 [Streblomastix strix]|uniref:Uncharacterized protein n=1 Tax=Streblomastix strix TaxID=222440 RepID=A0A5J4V165_9EUKA|nr:MAG: hypothetical protein EZS28_028125 [Streblomastix strix]
MDVYKHHYSRQNHHLLVQLGKGQDDDDYYIYFYKGTAEEDPNGYVFTGFVYPTNPVVVECYVEYDSFESYANGFVVYCGNYANGIYVDDDCYESYANGFVVYCGNYANGIYVDDDCYESYANGFVDAVFVYLESSAIEEFVVDDYYIYGFQVDYDYYPN